MLATLESVQAMIATRRHLIVAGDEALLRSLPKGNWVGGTIPYFMTPEGGQVSRSTSCPRFPGIYKPSPSAATACTTTCTATSRVGRPDRWRGR